MSSGLSIMDLIISGQWLVAERCTWRQRGDAPKISEKRAALVILYLWFYLNLIKQRALRIWTDRCMDFPGPNGHLDIDVCDEFDCILMQGKEITTNWPEFDKLAVARW